MVAIAAALQILLAAAIADVPPGATAPVVTAPAAAPVDDNYIQELQRAARAQRLFETRDWRALLHYRRSSFGGWRSEADGLGFFLAGPRGRRAPAAELDATIAALLAASPAADEHAQCRFPARWQWLKRALAIDAQRAPDRTCVHYETWRTGISGEAVTLVYASAYLNSPASMYGHTFLRVSRATGDGNPLLDYVVNFAADVDTENGFLYALKGVTGAFPGRFYVMPYYVKVQEYSNMESRDLWEYQLTLSRDQVSRLVAHAWETRTTHFDYYFFTRNCSYHLLTLIEAAAPELDISGRFSGTVIPSDTVRAVLQQPGLVARVGTRPSLLSVMQQRRATLSAAEMRAAETWATAPAGGSPPPMPPTLEKTQHARVIDAAYDFLRYREGVRAEPTPAFKQRERQMFLARGRLGVPPDEVVTRPNVDAPERGHNTFRIGVGGGFSDQAGAFETLSLRAAIHDYLDPPRGYPADARLVMGDLRLRFQNRDRAARLDRFDIIDIVSAAPLDRWVRGVSWKVWFGADNARELGCERAGSPHAGWRCLYAGAITGGGIAARFGPRRSFLLLALAEVDVGAGPAFSDRNHFRLGGGGELMLTGGAGDVWRFELGARYAYYPVGQTGHNLRGRAAESLMLTRWLGLRAAVETTGVYAQATAELVAYH